MHDQHVYQLFCLSFWIFHSYNNSVDWTTCQTILQKAFVVKKSAMDAAQIPREDQATIQAVMERNEILFFF